MKNIMTKLSMLLCAALGVVSCENAEIDEQLELSAESLTGTYRIVSTLGTEADTKVSIDDDGVLSWENYEVLYLFESVASTDPAPSDFITFTIDPESISEDGKSAEFVGEGLVAGKSYYAVSCCQAYMPSYIDNVDMYSIGAGQSDINKPGCSLRSDCFVPSTDTMLSTLTFSNEFSIFELTINWDEAMEDVYDISYIKIYSNNCCLAADVLLNKYDGTGSISVLDSNGDIIFRLSPTISVYLYDDSIQSSGQSVIKLSAFCDSAVVPSDSDVFLLTLETSDGLGEFTYEIPARQVENGKYYTLDVTITADNYTNYAEQEAADQAAVDRETILSDLTSTYTALKDQDLVATLMETKRSDLSWPGSYSFPTATDTFYTQTFTSSESSIGNKWTALYEGVLCANKVIEGLAATDDALVASFDEDEYKLVKAQAHFFRGLFYFYLNTSFNEGAVPIFNFVPATDEEYYQPCSSSANVKAFYREDMEYAEAYLPSKGSSNDWSGSELGNPTSETASAVLGTSYLYDNEYTTAQTYFKKVIDNSSYYLMNSNDLASETYELNSETLLEIAYTYGGDDEQTTTINMDLSNVGGWTTIYTSYWLMHAMTHEPVDHLNSDNRIDLVKDIHGDIYYSYEPTNFQPIVSLGGVNHKIYPVMATLNDVKGYMNGMYEEDEISWVDESDYAYNTVPSEVTGCSSMAWPDSLYVFLKKVRVDSNGDIIAQTRADFQTDENEGYEFLANNQDMMPTRPMAGDRSKGAIKIYDAVKTSASSADRDSQLFELYSDNSTPYRYKQRSDRSYYSVSTFFDMDKGDYTYLFPADHLKSNNYGMFRKYTNWQTRTLETNVANSDSAINMRLIRLSDIYLMYAECLIEGGTNDSGLSEALKYVNKVRKRAGTVLVGEEKYGEYVGSATYQDTNSPAYNVFAGDYYDLYDTNNIANDASVGKATTSDDIIDTASELMDHLMYYERPLELHLDGHAIRTNDMRRWGITKKCFEDLSTNWAFSTVGVHFFNSETIYNTSTSAIDTATSTKNWKYRFKYLPSDDDFNMYFLLKNGTWAHAGVLYEFTQPAANYDDSKAYYPIPNTEATTNPNINSIVDIDIVELQ